MSESAVTERPTATVFDLLRPSSPIAESHVAPATPILRWAGSKHAIRDTIAKLLPDTTSRVYREPFLGSASIYFHLANTAPPAHAFLSDALQPLIDTYITVRDNADHLIEQLDRLVTSAIDAPLYAQARDTFNASNDPTDRALWFIYLNKTCFNGLCRFNRKGEFNTPFGDRAFSFSVEEIRAASSALRKANLSCKSYVSLLDDAHPGDVIYLDPPYVPVSKTANFVGYAGSWTDDDHDRLASIYRELDARGCLLVLSNSDTERVRRLYAGYEITEIQAPRRCSAKTSGRGSVSEVVVRNTGRWPSYPEAP